MEKHLETPLTEEKVKELHAGDYVYISGTVYTARDAAHKRMIETLEKGESLPFDMQDQIIYYLGPTPNREGQVIGSPVLRQAAVWTVMHLLYLTAV